MDKYYVTNHIGEGGFGECYLIETKKGELKQEKLVAKVVNMSRMTEIEKKKSIQEIKILNIINHINLIKLVESYTTKNLLCIIMELGEYGSLDGEIEARKKGGKDNICFAEDEILFIFLQIVLGVKYLHDNNIIHCDIKSNNVILFSNGMVKLSDFGISNILSSNKDEFNKSERFSNLLIQGSIYYLAPEIYSNMQHDKKSDYWSIGCLLLELCSLERVFRKYSMQEMIIFSVKNEDQFKKEVNNHIEMYGVNKRYSQDLVNIIKGLLNPNPEERLNIDKLFQSNKYILNFINMFLNTCKHKHWNQFNSICKELSTYTTQFTNERDKVDILKHPFWIKQDVDTENKNSKFFLKQSLDEWFKSQEVLTYHNFSKSKSSIISNQSSNNKDSETNPNKYKEIIDYFRQKEKNKQNGRRLSRKEILLQLETTVEFFVTQLSAFNSKKVTTEEIIKRNLASKLFDNNGTKKSTNSIRNSCKQRNSQKLPSTINKTNSNASLRKNLRVKYDKEREQLREIMRKGRAEAKLKGDTEINTVK
ncbi:protein kinase [Cryptosporidium ubiquitum]|uniref:non-specific serine/threonine protein kinase n=1 Tax=Cryptosporidium ubiquitum TaxID=857276 RepID=A0A1J4MI02_9CRYT|nr:protein kinase [Cryptosporidium ubiquitum]OII73647.1 protein kinase [Cryptosporidium ubiquitum]